MEDDETGEDYRGMSSRVLFVRQDDGGRMMEKNHYPAPIILPKLMCMLIVSVLLLAADSLGKDYGRVMRPLMERYCVKCHGEEKAKAGINLSGDRTAVDILQERKVWHQVLEQLEAAEMPPKEPAPTVQERARMVAWIRRSLTEVDWKALHDPGRLSMARLTAVEYRNSIRDIFGVDLQAGVFLGKDPEGNTGFANDRESLSFPLFAFDDFMREAERAVDAYLGFANQPWRLRIEMEEAWKTASDKGTSLTKDGTGIVAKEPNSPFHFNVEAPFAGMFALEIAAKPFEGEPLSGLSVHVDGRLLERLVIEGPEQRIYQVTANLSAGGHTVTLAFDRDRAPIVQHKITPRVAPEHLVRQAARRSEFRELKMPGKFEDDKEAVKAWRRFNTVMRSYQLTRTLAQLLVERDQTDYEKYEVKNQRETGQIQLGPLGQFQTTKVPFNLSAGKLAVYLGIPQAEFERRLKQSHAYSHADYSSVIRRYRSRFKEKYPERVRKVPGRVAVDHVTLRSHAGPGDIMAALTTTSAEEYLNMLGERAYGRRLRPEEMKTLMRIHAATLEDTGSKREALRDAFVGLLVSPPFILLYSDRAGVERGHVSGTEIARRLARFLWLSVPDARLRRLAESGKIAEANTLRSETGRMLSDARFEETMQLFVEQWLNLEGLSQTENKNFNLLEAMRREPALLIRDLFRDNRSVLELVDARHTYLNELLAQHYDVPGVKGNEIRRVSLPTDQRGGLLAMAGPLTATSTPQRTSPVSRGAWIVELLLGTELSPPPPSVPELKTDNKARSVREELELHRQSPQCSGCHNKIDPYGFVLEHYDQFGAWRNKVANKRVNARMELPDGTNCDGLPEFRNHVITKRRDDLVRNFAERLLEFALGRELRYSDEATVRKILSQVEEKGFGARDLLYEVIESEPFLKQGWGDDEAR